MGLFFLNSFTVQQFSIMIYDLSFTDIFWTGLPFFTCSLRIFPGYYICFLRIFSDFVTGFLAVLYGFFFSVTLPVLHGFF
jgi:hypothetical protein